MINLSQASAINKDVYGNVIVAIFGHGNGLDMITLIPERDPKVLNAMYDKLLDWMSDECIDEKRLREVSMRGIGINGSD